MPAIRVVASNALSLPFLFPGIEQVFVAESFIMLQLG
jgi:hypothetical protein